MAKRRRLEIDTDGAPAPETKGFPLGVARTRTLSSAPPPVSRVAGEAAAEAALAEVAGAMETARTEGRMVVRLPLDAVDPRHIVRDRQRLDPDEMAALEASIAAHGQRTPVEVVETAPGRYGLISGWRRLRALAALRDRTGEARFAEVLALLRRPLDAGAAYTAMVEENEIRADLGHWERAGIVIRTVDDGVFPDDETATLSLFGAVSRARRSKVRTFVGLQRRLGDALRFGPEMTEKQGLALAARIAADDGAAGRLAAVLGRAAPATAEAERDLIDHVLSTPEMAAGAPVGPAAPAETAPTARPTAEAWSGPPVRITGRDGRLTLTGPGVDGAFRADLEAWLAGRERR